jgi:hypothetical protein
MNAFLEMDADTVNDLLASPCYGNFLERKCNETFFAMLQSCGYSQQLLHQATGKPMNQPNFQTHNRATPLARMEIRNPLSLSGQKLPDSIV